MQVFVDEVLARPVPEAPREGVDVALRRGRVGERARILVDAERERRRLERGRRQLPLGENPRQRRRQRAIRRQHRRLGREPVREFLVAVVVEEHLLDRRVECDLLELAEPRALETSTTISLRIASSSRRPTSATAPSSSACSR